MKLAINISPIVERADTKDELERKLPHGLRYSNDGAYSTCWGRYSSVDGFIFVYNIRKVNKKSKQIKFISGKKIGRTKKSEVIRRKHWVANVYKFDNNLLEAGVKVEQKSRNFIITKRK